MTTSTDNHSKRVLFDPNGEALDGDDLNDMQLFASLQYLENLIGSGVPDAISDPTSPGAIIDLELSEIWNGITDFSDLVFAPLPGCGYFKAGPVARTLISVPGPIIGMADEPFNGGGESFAPFRLGGLTFTTAIGHATLPRIDTISATFTFVDADPTPRDFEDATTRAPSSQNPNKTRRVQVTFLLTQGVPSANPVYPTPVSGAPICAVYVPALHNAVHDPANVRDMRWPIGGLKIYDVDANAFYRPGANPWSVNQSGMYAEANASGTDPLYAHCPTGQKTARLIGVGVYGVSAASASCQLVRVEHNLPAIPTVTLLADFDPGEIFTSIAGFRTRAAVQIMDDLATNAPGKGLRVANRRIGTPMWCNGFPAGPAHPGAAGETPMSRVALKLVSEDVALVSFVRFYVMHGM